MEKIKNRQWWGFLGDYNYVIYVWIHVIACVCIYMWLNMCVCVCTVKTTCIPWDTWGFGTVHMWSIVCVYKCMCAYICVCVMGMSVYLIACLCVSACIEAHEWASSKCVRLCVCVCMLVLLLACAAVCLCVCLAFAWLWAINCESKWAIIWMKT